MQNLSKGKLDGNVTLFPPLDDDHEGLPAHVAEKFQRITKRRRSPSLIIYDDSEEDEIRELALETAVLVHNEIQHMQNSIAELENLLRRPADPAEVNLDALNGKDSRNQVEEVEGEILMVKSESSLESGPSSGESIASDD